VPNLPQTRFRGMLAPGIDRSIDQLSASAGGELVSGRMFEDHNRASGHTSVDQHEGRCRHQDVDEGVDAPDGARRWAFFVSDAQVTTILEAVDAIQARSVAPRLKHPAHPEQP
jgi:hypothetical protein